MKPFTNPPIVLTIAGSDCSGGAGIQADIKTISSLGCYAASVITAVTSQNTLGVQAVLPLPATTVSTQIESVCSDLKVKAVKIGMIPNEECARVIVKQLKKFKPSFIVYDPVMVSTSGKALMEEETIAFVSKELFPLCTLITPNLPEASRLLADMKISNEEEMDKAATELAETYHTSILLKGGHLDSSDMMDILHLPSSVKRSVRHFVFHSDKIISPNLHGTGCTLSSAIASYLSGGYSLPDSVEFSKDYLTEAIRQARNMEIGHGNGPLWHFFRK